MSSRKNQRSPQKIIILLALITLIATATSIVLTAYPQHLYVDNKTSLGTVQFKENNIAIVKGNQVQYSSNDIIPLEGRSYIRFTGRQVSVAGNIYTEGIRTVFATWNQNILFQQAVGTFNTNQVVQIGVGSTVINLIPVSTDVITVNTVDLTGKTTQSNYNIQFQGTAYLSEGGVMLRMTKSKDNISISLIGSGYKNIWMRVI